MEEYFAARDAEEAAGVILSRAENWFRMMDTNGYLDKLKEAWSAYHGAYYTDASSGHKITFSGEQGELVNLPVNHFRNICRNILTMVTANRPSLEARATNTDYKSLVQTKLANGLLDYYMREKRLEDYLHKAIEFAIVLGAGYIKMEWNATSGEVYDYNEETNTPIYEGDVVFTNLDPFNVVLDSTKENENDHDWVLTRTFKNRFDLAAKFPELKHDILRMETKDQIERYSSNTSFWEETDDIPIYEFYHKKTEAMPEGRYLLFVDSNVVLMDTPLPYRDLPVYRVSPATILGTPFGYSDTFDLLPIQDALNSVYSTILSNHNAFGVQNILSPRGADVTSEQVSGGMNFIEYNAEAGRPEALNLLASSPESYEFISLLERTAETISGVNSVSRGNPESSLKSGNALALIQSMALQFVSGLQQSYVKMIENVGTGLVNMLKDFAAVPRIASIVGESNKTYMKEFTGDDLSSINRVIVDMGNPLARCLKEGTDVLMYDGTKKKVEDIEIGEKVMGPDSKPRTVQMVNTGTEMMYDIHHKSKKDTFLYGCNESHILTLKYCSDDHRYNAKKGDIIDITVRDFLKLPERHQRLLQGFRTKVEFEEKSVDVPSYILGAWLGDGHSATTAITTMDDEILTEWENYAKSINMNVRISTNDNSGRASIYFITSGVKNGKSNRNPFMNELRQMELINNKHIPKIYLNNSEENRLQLLAGLIDTDGSIVDQTFVITQKNDRLSDDICYLAQSLGFKVTRKKVPSQSGPNSNREIIGECNKITIGGDTHRIPTRLKRKQAKKVEKSRDWLNYGIRIKEVGVGKYYGFTLEEEPHFLLGDFTVTHNTTAGRVQMAEQMLQMGLITTPEQYFMVINTGRLDTMTDSIDRELLLVKAENEKLMSNEDVDAAATDKHSIHIKEHKTVLADPDLRRDPELVQKVLSHIQEHINLLRNTDPDLLMIIGEQPLAPPGGSPANQPQGNVPQGDISAQELMQAPQAMAAAAQNPATLEGTIMPQPAEPPAPFDNMPVAPNQNIPQS